MTVFRDKDLKEVIKLKGGLQGGPEPNMTAVFIRRGDMDTGRDSRNVGAQRDTTWGAQGGGSHVQASHRGLRKNKTCSHFDLRSRVSRSMRKHVSVG